MISIEQSIVVNRDHIAVFDFYADVRNDNCWRKEINHTTLSSEAPVLGCIAIEDSFLSKKVPHYVTKMACTQLIYGQLICFETLPDIKFKMKSHRSVKAIDTNKTELTYQIEFDERIVKHGVGFNLPRFLVRWVALSDMKKYLSTLKQILESSPVQL
jgi:hypothetical protein